MQLGMVGLGRMGANMVRRLIKDGHTCMVFDGSPKSVEELAKDGAVGSSSIKILSASCETACHLADDSGSSRRLDYCRDCALSRSRRHPDRRRQLVLHR